MQAKADIRPGETLRLAGQPADVVAVTRRDVVLIDRATGRQFTITYRAAVRQKVFG